MIGGVTIVQCIIILVVVDGIITVPLCTSLVSITEIGTYTLMHGQHHILPLNQTKELYHFKDDDVSMLLD